VKLNGHGFDSPGSKDLLVASLLRTASVLAPSLAQPRKQFNLHGHITLPKMDGFVFWLNEVVAYALLYDSGCSDLPAPSSIATPSKHGGTWTNFDQGFTELKNLLLPSSGLGSP
jgi:hypothetical protein